MLLHKFVPSDAKGEKKTLEGYLVLRCPAADEVIESFSELGLEIDDKGEVNAPQQAQMIAMAKIGRNAHKFIEEVSLKIIEDGVEIKTFEEFSVYPECRKAYFEVAGMIVKGFRPSKNLKA